MPMLQPGGEPNEKYRHPSPGNTWAQSTQCVRKGSHCLDHKTSVLIICCTFLILKVFTFPVFYE